MSLASALPAQIRYVGRRAGPVGWIGTGLMLLAAGVVAVGRVELDPANRAAADHLASLKVELTRAMAPGAALRNPADASAAVAGQFPPAEEGPAFIQDVQARASRAGIQVDRAEYRLTQVLGKRALQLQMVMPAHGTYPELRSWIESLLTAHPSAALDELSLRRESDGAAQLEARVVFSYYAQAAR